MKAFKGLLKKDLYIAKYTIFTWLIFLFLVMFGSIIFANYLNEPMVIVGFATMLMVAHLGVLPLSVLNFLKKEGKTQLWLYNPQSSTALLASKIAVAVVFQVISQILLIIFSYFVLETLHISGVGLSSLLIVHGAIFASATYYMCWVIFYWCVYHSLDRFPSLSKFRWVVIVLMIFTFNLIEMIFLKIQAFKEYLYQWTVSLPGDQQFSYTDGSWSMNLHAVEAPVIPIILYFILGVCLLFFSNRLLDRKVEV